MCMEKCIHFIDGFVGIAPAPTPLCICFIAICVGQIKAELSKCELGPLEVHLQGVELSVVESAERQLIQMFLLVFNVLLFH